MTVSRLHHLIFITLPIILLHLLLTSPASAARQTHPSKVPKAAILLSSVSTLTLRAGKPTAHRRVSAVPQLTCAGPKHLCAQYTVDVMRCKNEGSDYDDDNIQWTCTATLPEEFKLGSTDVSCEGYESSEDPYVLKGSCGVQYRLALTRKGQEKLGGRKGDFAAAAAAGRGRSKGWKIQEVVFWLIFVAVVGTIVLAAFGCISGPRQTMGGGPAGWGGGGGGGGWGGGGGGGGGGGPDDPPPPYDWQPPRKPRAAGYSTRSTRSNRSGGGDSWRPGFWSGALGGAAAGYAMGNRGQNRQQGTSQGSSWLGRSSQDSGEGSSRSPGSSSSSSRYESTGFGSTSRR